MPPISAIVVLEIIPSYSFSMASFKIPNEKPQPSMLNVTKNELAKTIQHHHDRSAKDPSDDMGKIQ